MRILLFGLLLLMSCGGSGKPDWRSPGIVIAKQYSPDTQEMTMMTTIDARGYPSQTPIYSGYPEQFAIVIKCGSRTETLSDKNLFAVLNEGDSVIVACYESFWSNKYVISYNKPNN